MNIPKEGTDISMIGIYLEMGFLVLLANDKKSVKAADMI